MESAVAELDIGGDAFVCVDVCSVVRCVASVAEFRARFQSFLRPHSAEFCYHGIRYSRYVQFPMHQCAVSLLERRTRFLLPTWSSNLGGRLLV